MELEIWADPELGGRSTSLGTDQLKALAEFFPRLESLKIRGSFTGIGSVSPFPLLDMIIAIADVVPFDLPSFQQSREFVAALSHFPRLHRLHLPFPYTFEDPIACRHVVDRLVFELSDPISPLEEEKERRVKEDLFDRLRSTGFPSRQHRTSDFLEPLKKDFLDLASGLPFLESIMLDVSVRGRETSRRLDWSVVRLATRIVPFDNPLPKSASFNLEAPFCICRWLSEDTKELRRYLEDLPPLFSRPADFTPEFTLDRFLVRQ